MASLKSDLDILESAMHLFFQTMKRPQHWSRVLASTGLSIDRPAAAVLHILMNSKNHRCRVQDVAHLLGVEAPSVTRKTQELEQLGLLHRVPDPHDKRGVELRITPRGRTVAKRVWQAQQAVISQALSSWDASQRHIFVQLFKRFSNDFVVSAEVQRSNKQPRR